MSHPVTQSNFLTHHDAHPLVLDLFVTKKFKRDWWGWEPETLKELLSRNNTSGVSEAVWNKLQAIRTIHVAPGLVFDEWEVFLPVITALNNVTPDFNVLQLPSPARLYAGIYMVKAIEPDDEFSDEVKRFVAASLLHEGIYYGPGELSFVQHLLRRPYYICTACGNKEEVLLDHDGVCDACGKDWFSSLAGRKVKAQTTKIVNTYDETPIKQRFIEASKDWDKFEPDDDEVVDVQVCKLAAAVEYHAKLQQRFYEQKEALDL